MHVPLLPLAVVLLTTAEQGTAMTMKLTGIRSAACILQNRGLQDNHSKAA
jgi:hypothetical protein